MGKLQRLIFLKFSLPTLLLLLPPHAWSSFDGKGAQQLPLDPETDETYLRLVWSNGTEYYVRHWECPDGIWSEESLQRYPPSCACVKGAFLVSKSICDEEFEILTGDEHCYDISKSMIRKFTPLTGKMGLKGSASSVFRKDAPYAARLVSRTPWHTVGEPMDYVFRLNEPYNFSMYATLGEGAAARLGCLPAQEPLEETPLMQIGKLPPCATQFRGDQGWCGVQFPFPDYLTTIQVGKKWGPKSSGSGAPYPGSCAASKGNGRRRKRSVVLQPPNSRLSGTFQFEDDPKNCKDFPPSVIELPVQSDESPVSSFVVTDIYDSARFHTDSLHQTEVNDQTLMIVKNLINYHLGPTEAQTNPKVRLLDPEDLPAFKYVQLARSIMGKVCPQEDVPDFVLEFMTRVFRMIYIDISAKYPYPETLKVDGKTNKYILEALQSCRDSIPDTITAFIRNKTCPDAGYSGSTMSNGDKYLFGQNMSTIPEDLRFDPGSMDMALETVWKMMLLVHYYCAPNFTSPLYHSEFSVKFEAFFNNPAVLYRWYHPGPSNNVLEIFLSAFNLRGFANSVDRCVTTANAMSEYTGWLKRPADARKWKPRFSPDEEGAADETLQTQRRRKRYYFENNIWDEKAYCLRNSKDIVSEVRSASIIGCRNRPAWFQQTD